MPSATASSPMPAVLGMLAAILLLQPSAGAPLLPANAASRGCHDLTRNQLPPVACPVGTAMSGWRVSSTGCAAGLQKITPWCSRKVELIAAPEEKLTHCDNPWPLLASLDFLRTHPIGCPVGHVLTSWRVTAVGCPTILMWRKRWRKRRLAYTCARATVLAPQPATASTQCKSTAREKTFNFLDRHTPRCTPGSVLSSWRWTGEGCTGTEKKIEFTCTHTDPTRRPPAALAGTNDGRARGLQACVGECDSDSQCGAGLKCFQRDGFTSVPGCIGHGKKDWDYCYDPLDGRPTALVSKGSSPNTRSPWPVGRKLGACQGDCDGDTDCAAGLKCWQRSRSTSGVPGCDFGGVGDVGHYDYCYDPASEVRHLVDRGRDPSTATTKLLTCQGDCDADADCAGELVCFKRDKASTPVPGCTIGGAGDIGTHDYCVDPLHGQRRPGATVHERASKLNAQPAGAAPSPAEVHAAAAAECSSRGQYLCSAEQSCNAARKHTAGHSRDGAWTAIGGPGGKFMYVPKQGEVRDCIPVWTGPWWNRHLDESKCNKKEYKGCGLTQSRISEKEVSSALFSCCGDPFAGARKKPATKIHAVGLGDLAAGLTTAAAAEWREGVAAGWESRSDHVYITAEFMLGVAAEAGCEIASSGCMAQIRAEVRATMRAGLTGSATIGGVPVVGEVYVEFTAGATATATASVGQDGAELSVEASADVSVTYGATVSGELNGGVTVGADGAYTVGASATASKSATVTLEEVSVGAELKAEAGVSVDGNFELATEDGHGVAGGASVCAGCLGVGFKPSFKLDGCSLTVGADGSGSLGVGASFSGAGTVNFCSLGGALADAAEDVGVWALHGLQDAANGFVEPLTLAAAMIGVDLPGIASDVAEDTERIATEIADGTVQLVDDTGAAFSTAAEWSEDAATASADWLEGAGMGAVDVLEGAGTSVLSGICLGLC